MRSLLYAITMFIFALSWLGCKKEGRIDFFDSKAPAPVQVSDVKVVATPGGGVLTYKIPSDSNFSYAKAVYEIRPGIYREASASYYQDTLLLVGFGDTLTHEVKIYSVGKNEKKSEPVSVSVTPLTPPVESVFKTLILGATFGGVQVDFRNIDRANLAIQLIRDTTGMDTWSTVETFYTGAPEGRFSVRGFDTTVKKFGVVIRDRWNNRSDTLIKMITPLYEELIPKTNWKVVTLPNDTWTPAESYTIEHLWDNNIEGYGGIFASTNSSVLPQWFTIDLGEKVVISRVVEHQAQPASHQYAGSAPKTIEIWGSNAPNPDGSWASWDSLGLFHSFKPSGLPLGQTTAEDSDYGWLKGEDFEFDHILPAYRYIRWKTLETYASSGQVVIAELDIYGQTNP